MHGCKFIGPLSACTRIHNLLNYAWSTRSSSEVVLLVVPRVLRGLSDLGYTDTDCFIQYGD